MLAHRSPWPVTSPPTRAVRAIRPVGSFPAPGGGSSASMVTDIPVNQAAAIG
jgi:hypothetical protein